MDYQLLCTSANGMSIVYNAVTSHVATHFADTPGLADIVQEVLAATTAEDPVLFFETDLKRTIGKSDLVLTDEQDEIVYAKRPNREGYTRFTKSQAPGPSSIVTIALKQLDEHRYELTSAWIGPLGHPFPDDAAATPESIVYWSTHALAWGTQEVVTGTETTTNPWT